MALLDEEVIPVEFATVQSGNVSSRGHRFLGADEITIKNAASYVDTLKEKFLLWLIKTHVVSRSQTIYMIWQPLKMHPSFGMMDLLEEINYLVEWPTALRRWL